MQGRSYVDGSGHHEDIETIYERKNTPTISIIDFLRRFCLFLILTEILSNLNTCINRLVLTNAQNIKFNRYMARHFYHIQFLKFCLLRFCATLFSVVSGIYKLTGSANNKISQLNVLIKNMHLYKLC